MKKNKNKSAHYKFIEIYPTTHSIEQFKTRVTSFIYDGEDAIREFLVEAVEKGNVYQARPSINNPAPGKYDIYIAYRGVYLVVVAQNSVARIVTCRGDETYRGWYHNNLRTKLQRLRSMPA